MTIARRTGAVGTGWTEKFGTSATITINKPSNVASGDLLLAVIHASRAYNVAAAPTMTTPASGWTLQASRVPLNGSGGSDGGQYDSAWVYTKIAGGSEPSTYSWVVSGAQNQGCGLIEVYTGVDITTPMDVTPTTNGGNSGTATVTGVTTVTAGALAVAIPALEWGLAAATFPPSGWTNGSVDTTNLTIATVTKSMTSAGSTGSPTFTTDGASGWGTFMLALRPAGSGSAVHGDSASTVTVTGGATGHRGANTTTTGTVTVTGAASGHRGFHTTAAGQVAIAGIAAGHVDGHDSAIGSITVTGATAGHVGKHQTASGAITVTGTAAGSVQTHQSAAGTIAIIGAAAGTVHRSASAVSTITVTGIASGTVISSASASATQTVTVTGIATGHAGHHATASETITVAGAASGTVTHHVAGEALGQLTITGTATGHVGHVGTAEGTILILGSATVASNADYKVTIRNLRIAGPSLEPTIPTLTVAVNIPEPVATIGIPAPTVSARIITPTGGFR